MKLVSQAFVGGFLSNNIYSDEYILSAIKHSISDLDSDIIIIGWNTNTNLYKSSIEYIHKNNKEVYLWMPVFSEVSSISKSKIAIDYNGNIHKSVSIADDEDFSFLCPIDDVNINNVINIYNKYFSELDFDGIFLDKIRYSSFANGFDSALGCYCELCRNEFHKYNIDIDNFIYGLQNNRKNILPDSYLSGRYNFEDSTINDVFRVRANIITNSVKKLSNYFKSNNLKVGLDIYTPIFSYYVGQDIVELSKIADFIKLMIYRITNAPAGIEYEYNHFKNELKKHHISENNVIENIWCGNLLSDNSFLKQMSIEKDSFCDIYAGFEVNYKKHICESNNEYIKNNIKLIKDNNFKGAVLSWDILSLRDINNISKIIKRY